MRTLIHPLGGSSIGSARSVTSLHFGEPGSRRALLQASLHADEIPPMLVAQHLRRRLTELEAAGRLQGEIVLLPACNPIGLGQQSWGRLQGRFEWGSGQNFNRHYPDLALDAAARVRGLGSDPAANTQLLRKALHEALAAIPAPSELQALRQQLLKLAIDADVVLDLHCDNQAVMHLYATPQHGETARQLGQCLQAPLALLAEESGDYPFDEACSMIWPKLQAALADRHPVPLSGFAATVEHRGETDVSHELAAQDADGLLRFLALQGFIAAGAELGPPPAFDCSLRPLAGCMPITAPHAGLVVFHVPLGAEVEAGQRIAEIVDPLSGESTPLCSPVAGLQFARELQRWAQAGQSVAKVAGHQALRSGKLLSA
jgi:predicted deacylase